MGCLSRFRSEFRSERKPPSAERAGERRKLLQFSRNAKTADAAGNDRQPLPHKFRSGLPDGRPTRLFRKKDYLKPVTFALSYNDLSRITNLRLPCKKGRTSARHIPEESSQCRPNTNDRKQPSGTSDFETDDLRKNGTAPSCVASAIHSKRFLSAAFSRYPANGDYGNASGASAPVPSGQPLPAHTTPRPIRQKDETDNFCARLRTSFAVRRIRYTPSRMSSRFPRRNFSRPPVPVGPDKNRGVRRIRHTPLFPSNLRSRYTDATPMIPFSDPPIKSSR